MKRHIIQFREIIYWQDILGILTGSFILAIAVKWILIPANLLTGGITGLAIILNYFTKFEVWIWFALLNIPLLIAGYKLVSRRFIVYSLLATIFQSLLLAILIPINIKIDDLLLSAVLGGVLSGIGIGMIFHFRGSSGGIDIIAIIIRRYWGINIGTTFFAGNLIVLLLSLVSFNIELALFSAISIFISSKTIDTVEAGPSVARTAMIISNRSEDIAEGVMNYLHRGCTFIPATGAYSGDDRKIILITLGKTQIPRLKEIVFQLDPSAFMTITESIETYGKGFKSSQADF
ncbi:MAG: YitT family protein [Syntrophomonadaceae bacterium]|nr:YitT family protein [Syntrophomonadaceae bacterium]